MEDRGPLCRLYRDRGIRPAFLVLALSGPEAAGLNAQRDAAALPAELTAALRFVPELRTGAALCRVARLPGGSVNELWRVNTAARSYALRLPVSARRAPGAARAREYRLQSLAAAAGLAPRIVHAEPHSGLMITEWVSGQPWPAERYAQRASWRLLAALLVRLQCIEPPGAVSFRPGPLADRYASLAAARGNQRRQRLAAQVAAVQRHAVIVASLGLPPVIVHGDLGAGNVLGARQLRLIDWEYAQIASPCYECGSLLALYPALALHGPRLPSLRALTPRDYRRGLLAATSVYRGLNALWQAARAP